MNSGIGTGSLARSAVRRISIGFTALGLLLLGCGAPNLHLPQQTGQEPVWAQWGGSAAGTGVQKLGPEPPLRLLWQRGVGGVPVGPGLIDGSLLLLWTHAPAIRAFDLVDGAAVGKRNSDDLFCGGNLLSGDILVFAEVGSSEAGLRALDRRSGKSLWHKPGFGCAWMAARGDTLWTAAEGGTLAAFSLAEGEELWTAEFDGQLRVGPSVSGDTVYIGDSLGDWAALGAADGEEKWRIRLEAGIRTRPVEVGGLVYCVTGDGTLNAVAAADGELVWEYGLEALPTPELAVADGAVVVGTVDREILAFEATTGEPRWRFATQGVVRGALAATAKTVYCGSADGYLYALDIETGRLQWKYQLDGPLLSGISLGQQRLAVVTEKKTAYVFGP
jgi:outer membrane protein assembly factor BamB